MINQGLKNNLQIFEELDRDLAKSLLKVNTENVKLLNDLLENYTMGNLIINNGDIYCVVDNRENDDTDIAIRNFVARKINNDLTLSNQEYEIQEEILTAVRGFYEFSIYRVKEKS